MKKSKKTLSDSDYKNLIDTAPFGVIIHGEDYIIYANHTALQIGGFDMNIDVTKLSLLSIIQPQYHQQVKERLERIKKKEKLSFFEMEYIRPNGEKIIVETQTTLVNYNGIEAFQVTLFDITAKKEVEAERLRTKLAEETNRLLQKEIEERKKAEKELHQAQEFTTSLIESSTDVICATDLNGNIVEFNPEAQKTFGYTKQEIKNVAIKDLFVDEKQQQHVQFILETDPKGFKGEIWNRKKDGTIFLSYLTASAIRNESGDIIGTMGVSRDITSVRKAEEQAKLQAAKLKAIFEYSPTYHMWTVNSNLIITEHNSNLKTEIWEAVGVKIIRGKTNAVNILSLTEERAKFWREKYSAAFNGEVQHFEITYNKKKERVWREVFLYPIQGENNIIKEVSGMSHDITDKKNAELNALEKTAKLHAVFDSGTHFIWTINKRKIITSCNNNFTGFLRKKANIKVALNRTDLTELIDQFPKHKSLIDEKIRLAFKGIPQIYELDFVLNDTTIWFELFLQPIVSGATEIEEISCLMHNITEKKVSQEKLIKQAAKLNTIIESSSHNFWTVNREMELTSFNSEYKRTAQKLMNASPVQGDSLKNILLINNTELNESHVQSTTNFWQKKYELAFEGKEQHFEYSFTTKAGNEIWFEYFLNPVFDSDGSILEVSGISHNITQQKVSELQIKQSLKEKEILLKEVHHRVKNNLQVISSLLNLQSSFIKDTYTLGLLRESQNRIKSMSYIHEILYQNNDFSNIPFDKYIKNVVSNLVDSYRSETEKIEFQFDLDEISLSLDLSIPCGLIVNELISNALKYAFPKQKNGKIEVFIKEQKENTVQLRIKDNGVGFPENINLQNTNTLGLQLVTALIDQIDATYEMKSDNGTEFLITFKYQRS